MNFSDEPYSVPSGTPHAVGTFIQSSLYAAWDDKRAAQEFSHMKAIGMDYMIMGDCVTFHKETGSPYYEILYPSAIEEAKDYFHPGYSDQVDFILKYCQKYGMKCFLGIGNQVDKNLWYFYNAGQREAHLKFCDFSCKVAADLYRLYKNRYPETFCGFYYVPEMWNNKAYDNEDTRSEIAAFVCEGFNKILDTLNSLDPNMPLLFSPYAAVRSWNGGIDGTMKFYTEFFSKTNFRGIDVFCPQDSVGAGGQYMELLDEWTKGYKDAISASGSKIHFWSNCEDFITPQDTVDAEWMTADVKRFIQQMSIVGSYVEKIVTFAYPHYYSPREALPGFDQAYVQYLKTGETDKTAPTAPHKVSATKKGDSVTLKWTLAADEYGIAKYNIYKLNPDTSTFELCGRNVAKRGNGGVAPKRRFTDKTNPSAFYAIEAMDCAGNYSKKLIVKADGGSLVNLRTKGGESGIFAIVDDLAAYAKQLNVKRQK